jgi:hypothetical protein
MEDKLATAGRGGIVKSLLVGRGGSKEGGKAEGKEGGKEGGGEVP